MKYLVCIVGLIIFSISISSAQFTSAGSGDWNVGSTWVGGVVPPSDGSGGTITIVSPHTVTIGNSGSSSFINISEDQLTIQSGATLQVDILSSLTILNGSGTDLLNNGTLNLLDDGLDGSVINVSSGALLDNLGTISMPNLSGVSAFNFLAGSTYQHNQNGGTIPMGNWNSTSSCVIVGVTNTIPTQINQSYGNLNWSCSGQTANITLFNANASISGSLTVSDTGSGGTPRALISSTTNNTSFTVGQNLTISGTARFYVTTTGNPVTVNVNGFYQNTSTNSNGIATSGLGNLNVKGNFTHSSGTLVGNASSQLNFNGTAAQTFAGGGTFTNVNFSVSNNSLLSLGTSALTGLGAFTLNNGATLYVGSADAAGAIQLSPATAGNIQVSGTRTYSSTSKIVYNGASAQQTGDGFPLNVNLEIANSNGVTNNNIGITNVLGTLTLTSGAFNIGNSNTLNVQSNFIVTGGTIGGDVTSSLTFSGSGTLSTLNFASGSEYLNNLTVDRNATLVLGTDLTVAGSINLNFGNLNFSGRTLTMNGGSITSSGTGLISSSTSNLIFGGSTFTGAIPFSGSGNQLNNLTFGTPGGAYTWASSVTVNTAVNLTAGTLTHTTGLTMATNSTFNKGGGSMTGIAPVAVTSYNVNYTSAGNTGLELPSVSTALNNLTIAVSSGTVSLQSSITINGNMALSGGTFSAGSNNISMKGASWTSNGGAFSGGTGIVTFSSTTSIFNVGTSNFTNMTVSGSGNVTLPANTLNISGNLVNNGTINRGTGITNFNGTTTISGSSAPSFNNVIVSGTLTGSTGTFNVFGDFTNNGTFAHNQGTVVFNGVSDILGSSSTSFFGLSITGTFNAPATTLNIAGNFSNAGTFNHNNGTLLFDGTVTPQSITGTFTAYNINVSNPTFVNNNGNIGLVGVLTLVGSGAFDADGSGSGVFTLRSLGVSSTGSIASLGTPANFTGTVTVERFINGPQGWRYLSMPITNGTVAKWKTNFPVTGNFSDPSPAGVDNVTTPSAASIYRWDATLATPAYVAIGTGASTSSTSLSSNVGYSAYSYKSGDFTISVTGTIAKGDQSIPLGTNGSPAYNLVPNPMPSAIDWDNITKTGLANSMQIRVANNQFASYVGGVGTNKPFGSWTGEIALGQSFWVQSTGATTMTIGESAKTSAQNQFLRVQSLENIVRIALESSSQHDDIVVRFMDTATEDFDTEFDAYKRKNGDYISNLKRNNYINLSSYTKTKNVDYSISAIPPLASCSSTVKLNVQDVATGKHSLSFSEMESMNTGYYLYLVDNFLKKETQVSNNSSYEFDVTSDTASFGSNRFVVRFDRQVQPLITADGYILQSSSQSNNQWYLDGSPIQGATGSTLQVTQSGSYTVRVSNGNCSKTSEPVVLTVTGVEETPLAATVHPNPVKDILIINLPPDVDSELRGMFLFDARGSKVVGSDSDASLLNSGEKKIDLSSNQSGLYILNIVSQKGNYFIRVIKQ